MRCALSCVLAVVVTACSSPSNDSPTSSAALTGDSLSTDLGSVDLDLHGTSIHLVTWTRVSSLQFSAVVTPPGRASETFRCDLWSAPSGGAELDCGDWSGTMFVIARDASGLTIAEGPQGPTSALDLSHTPQSLAVVAAHDLDALSVADRMRDAVGQLGSFSVPGEVGTVRIDSWQLFQERLDVEAAVVASDGSAARTACYDSEQTPDVWATPGSPASGLASASVIGDRMRTLATWKLANCSRHH